MKKFVMRMECLVEIQVEADSIEAVKEKYCDLNTDELDNLPKAITEIYDVFEVEEV